MIKALITSFFVFFSISYSHAVPVGVSKKLILEEIKLSESELLKLTEQSLEAHLFQEGHGRSCGLKSYILSHFETSNNLLQESLNNFSVVTEVYAPIYLCQGYDYSFCATNWQLDQEQWNVTDTLCEDDPRWNFGTYNPHFDH